MIDPNIVHSAYQLAQEAEKERVEQERIRVEKERQKQEREFDKNISLEIVNQLKQQNAQLKKEYEESQTELKKSKRYNLIMMIVTLISTAVAIASMIIAIVK